MKSNRRNRIGSYQIIASTILVAGSVMLSANAAVADNGNDRGPRMHELRDLNPDASRRDLRDMLRETRQQNRELRHEAASARMAASVQNVVNAARNTPSPTMVNRGIHSYQINSAGEVIGARSGMDFDLHSDDANITLGSKLMSRVGSLEISVNGNTKTVSAGSKVTAAEYIAVKQILSGSSQYILLDSSGRATGGGFDLSQIGARSDRTKIDDMYIPQNVEGFTDLSRRASLEITGNLVNAGTIMAKSGGSKNGFEIFADNITNEASGFIATAPSLTSVGVVFAPGEPAGGGGAVNLGLHASNSFSNDGTIAAYGDLNISAGQSFSNNAGNISATKNATIAAPNMVNSGRIESSNANVTLTTAAPSVLTIDNRNGVVAALNGVINLRETSYNDSFNTTMVGGDVLSKEFNVNAGQGTADIDVNELTGKLNQTGLASHVAANTAVLSLGNICLTGDPTYKNVGDISLDGDITVGEALTIVATGDITNSVALTISAGDATTGYPVTLIAGANITSGGANTPNIPPTGAGVAITLDGTASATGGNVFLGNNADTPVTISTRSTSTTGDHDGGNVLIAAFQNSFGGNIDLEGCTVLLGGRGNGTSGTFQAFADSVTTGTIDATGASNGGNISLVSAQPTSAGNVTYDAAGNKTSAFAIIPSVTNGFGVFIKGNLKALDFVTVQGGKVEKSNSATITTVSPTGMVQLFASGSGNAITADGGAIFTQSLTLAGPAQLSANPISTTAQFINAVGAGAPESDLELNCINPNVVVLNTSSVSDMIVTFAGSVVTQSGIVADTAVLISTEGSIGLSSATPLATTISDLTLIAPEGNVFVTNAAANTNLAADSSAKGTFNIQTGGNILGSASTTVTATDIVLSSGSSFNLDGTLTATNSATLTSGSSITAATVPATINAPILSLTSNGGNIGIDTSNRFTPGITTKTVTAIAAGSVFLGGPAVKSFELRGGSADVTFDYLGAGSTKITGNISNDNGTGDVVLATASGTLEVAAGVEIFSTRDMILQVLADSKKSKVILGKNSSLNTLAAATFGNITVAVGPLTAPVSGIQPKNVTAVATPGNSVFFGQGGAKAKAPLNTLFAKGANITLNNNFKAGNIALGGNVSIVADPPSGLAWAN
jgi:hypothetical protein